MNEQVNRLCSLIRGCQFDLSSEKAAQADIEAILKRSGIQFQREARLSDKSIIDFLVDGIGIEVKMRGARKRDIYRQLVRYAEFEQIECLVLVSTISLGLPETIGGKDVFVVKMSEGWL